MNKNQRQNEAQRRYQARKRLEAAGLPVPLGLERRPTRIPEREGEDHRLNRNKTVNDWRKRPKNQAKIRRQFEVRRQRARDYVHTIKRDACADCEKCFPPICMQFDHRPGTEKYKHGGVAKLVAAGAKIERIQAEIDKCDLVCSNCHWIRTAKQNEWYDECYL